MFMFKLEEGSRKLLFADFGLPPIPNNHSAGYFLSVPGVLFI